MKTIWNKFKEMLSTVNFDGLRCTIKGDPSIREIMGAFKRQKELDENDSYIREENYGGKQKSPSK